MPVWPCSRGKQPLLDLVLGKDKSVVDTALVELLVSICLTGKWVCERLSELSGGLGSEGES